MNNDLMIFNNVDFGEVRILNVKGEPWFIGKDVAEVLGYANPSKAVSTHVDEEDKILEMIAHSQNGNVVKTQTALINESGLYSLVLKSKLPQAKKFKRWVTSEILPSVRKHGAYMTNEVIEKTLTDPDFLIQLATQLKEEKQARKELEEKNRILVKENNKLETEVEYKEDVIIGLVKDVSLAEKRQRITQIVRHGTKKYAERYAYLYDEFDRKFHVDTKRRLDNAIRKGEVKKSVNRMAYICIHMGMTNELYEIACKIFENSVEQLKKEMWDTIAN